MKVPAAFAEQGCLVSVTGRCVTIDCDTRADAEELFSWLCDLAEETEE